MWNLRSIAATVRVALGVGLGLLALVVALVLSGSSVRVLGAGTAALQGKVEGLYGGESACQAGEVLPGGTSAVRLNLEAPVGPSVRVAVLTAGHAIARGTRGSGWTGADVTVPITPVSQTVEGSTVCFSLGASREPISMNGQQSPASIAASTRTGPLAGRTRIEYLSDSGSSWWSTALTVARRSGLGRFPSGTWVALLIAALALAAAALAVRVCLRELAPAGPTGRTLARLPAAAWGCALVAFLNAACWSLLSPPFQTPDEPSHFAYVQQLAEAHRLPVGGFGTFSPAEMTALTDVHQSEVAFQPSAPAISSRAQQRKLEADLASPLSRKGPGDAGVAAAEPPLYYALETLPYELGSGGTLLEQLQLMRLLSAVLGGLTALFAFMFVRETLPGAPWAWTVGGLGVALAPLLGFMSGAVNPDALLSAVAACLFYLLAQAFRRGLTVRLAVAIAAAVAAGLLAKLNFVGLVPGAACGMLVVAARAARASGRRTSPRAAPAALALALGGALVLVYLVSDALAGSSSLTFISDAGSGAAQGAQVPAEISYVWQLYLPRLPGMTDYFPGLFTARQLWFDGLVGLYGQADTMFATWVYDVALVPAAVLAVLFARALLANAAALRRRAPELLTYLAMAAGVLVMVGAASYASDVGSSGGPFSEPRYLLPMIVLLGAGLALAARGAGRRWGPAVGALIVVLLLGHDVLSQLLVVSRYYS